MKRAVPLGIITRRSIRMKQKFYFLSTPKYTIASYAGGVNLLVRMSICIS
jgi:hypothetical protein